METAIGQTVDDITRLQSQAQADALQVVNRAIQRRGGKIGRDETPADAKTIYAIAELLAALHRG